MCDVPSKRAQLWAGRGRHLATDSLVLGWSSWQKQLRIRSGGVSKFVHRKKRYDNIADMKLQKAPHTFATSWLFLLAATHDEECRSAWMSSQNSWKREYFSRSIGDSLLNYIFNLFTFAIVVFWHIIQFNKYILFGYFNSCQKVSTLKIYSSQLALLEIKELTRCQHSVVMH